MNFFGDAGIFHTVCVEEFRQSAWTKERANEGFAREEYYLHLHIPQ